MTHACSWSPPDIAQLLINEPRALHMDPREVAARAQRLEAIITLSTTVGVRPEWKNEVRKLLNLHESQFIRVLNNVL